MKRFFVAFALVCALAFPNIASAGNGMYLAPKFMMAFQNTGTVERSGMSGFGIDKYKQFTLGGAFVVGYDFWPQNMLPLRIELEGALRGNSEKEWNGHNGSAKETFNATTLFGNVYYDFHNEAAFTPYVGSQDERRTNFAWNVGGGVAFAVNDQVSIDAQYRYVDLGYTEVSSNYGGESQSVGIRPYNHEIMLGLRWGF